MMKWRLAAFRLSMSLMQAAFFHQAVQRYPGYTEFLRRLGNIFVSTPQRSLYGCAFGSRSRLVQGQRIPSANPTLEAEVCWRDQAVFAHDHGTPDAVDQLAHIAGPVVVTHYPNCLLGESADIFVLFCGKFFKKVLG